MTRPADPVMSLGRRSERLVLPHLIGLVKDGATHQIEHRFARTCAYRGCGGLRIYP